MPILAAPHRLPTPTPTPPRPPKRILWTSAAGDEIDLTDRARGYYSLPGRSGFGLPPREVVYDALPDGGALLRTIVDQVRAISIPLRVEGATQDQYLSRLRRLQAAFRHRRGGVDVPGSLTVITPDGARRTIAALYNGGLDAEEEIMDDLKLLSQPFPGLEFLALDPYWVGEQVGNEWIAGEGTDWFGATLPRFFTPTRVLGSVTVVLPGDADAYPVWTITGPGTPILNNLTTGRGFEFKTAGALDAGQVVTIDTRPDRLTVIDDSDADLYGSLEEFPDLWTLETGENVLQVEMTDSTDDSKVSFVADVRYQAGW